jgi:pentatricopeptide repeat protein
MAVGAGVCALVGAERHADARRLAVQAKKRGISIGTNLYNVELRECGNAKDLAGLTKTLARMDKKKVLRNEVTHATIVRGYIACERFDLAEEALMAAGTEAGVVAYGTMVQAYVSNGLLDRAEGVFNQMKHEGPPPNAVVYTSLICGYSRKARAREAADLLAEMEGAGFQSIAAHNAVLGLVARTWPDRVDTYLERMRESGTQPTVRTYNVILGQVKEDYDHTWATIRAMSRDGVSPDAVTLTTLLRSKAVTNVHIARRFRAKVDGLGVKPDRYLYNALVQTLARQGGLQDAEQVVASMGERGFAPDVVTYMGLLRGYFRWGEPEAAMQVYSRAVASGARLDERFYKTVLNDTVQQERYDDAVQVATDMRMAGLQVDLLKYPQLLALRDGEEPSAFERAKSWFGMPNARYAESWKHDHARPSHASSKIPDHPSTLLSALAASRGPPRVDALQQLQFAPVTGVSS